MKSLAIALLSAATVHAQQDFESIPEEFPTFTIDVSLEPRQRFKEVTSYFKDGLISEMSLFLDTIPSPIKTLYKYTSGIWKFTQTERYEEILGICDELDGEFSTSDCVLVNSLYELESFCTSVVAKQLDGTIIHGRMMDFTYPDDIRLTTYNAEFVNGDEFLFHAVMFGGTTGVYTGMRPDAFTLSLNQRFPENHYWKLFENIAMLFGGFQEVSWLNRKALTECDSFDCAYEMISKTPLTDKAYPVIAGVQDNQGVVMTRNNLGMAHEAWLGDDAWYQVQTNSDHWKDGCTYRCASATANMEKVGRENITRESLAYDVLMQSPNLNSSSIYVATFSASDKDSFWSKPVKGTKTVSLNSE